MCMHYSYLFTEIMKLSFSNWEASTYYTSKVEQLAFFYDLFYCHLVTNCAPRIFCRSICLLDCKRRPNKSSLLDSPVVIALSFFSTNVVSIEVSLNLQFLGNHPIHVKLSKLIEIVAGKASSLFSSLRLFN